MTQIQVISHGFYASDSFEHMTCVISFDWLKDVAQLTQESQLMDFTLPPAMSNRWQRT